LKTLRIRGLVFSGKAEGAKFVSLSWVRTQIKEKIGFDPYNGTLICASPKKTASN
jgi:CTP-dependent riboflavin kinase